MHWKKHGQTVSLSEQNLVDCARGDEYNNFGCEGGLPESAFKYTTQNGIESEVNYPYTASDDQCVFDASKVAAKSTG